MSSALLLLVLAFFADPELVGVYNWGILVYTFFQALTDASMRQIVISAVSDRRGLRFLSRYRFVVSVLGFVVVVLCCFVLSMTLDSNKAWQAWTLLPIAFAPMVTSLGIESVGRLQKNHQWHVLAAGQALAALCSLTIAAPILLIFQSPLGCSLGLLAAESVFSFWCWKQARNYRVSDAKFALSDRIRITFFQMGAYSGLAWLQGQADRVLIGAFSGTANLGLFSMATALGRSLGDAMAASSANVLRSAMGHLSADDEVEIRRRATKVLNRGIILSVVGIVISVVLSQTLVASLLGPEWLPAINVVPILALCTVPSMLSWSSAVLHVAQGTSRKALVAPVVGICFALPIALLAAVDLSAAAWLVLLRELCLCSVAYCLVGRAAPWTSYVYGVITVFVGSAIIWYVG